MGSTDTIHEEQTDSSPIANDDKVIRTFASGQKDVALVINKDYGQCIRKTKNHNTSTIRIEREVNIQNEFNSIYYPKIYHSEINSENILIYEEYIEGPDLLDILCGDNVYKNNEVLCLNLLRELIVALTLIWNKSIVHRDLKPNNIKMRNGEVPVILDLGIAKLLDSKDNITTSMWFTEGYAPIEQFTNRIDLIDKRTDFFSLGVIVYELFFGRRLFKSNWDVIHTEPDFNIEGFDNSNDFNKIVSKLLQKVIYKRYRRAEDIITEIDDVLERKIK